MTRNQLSQNCAVDLCRKICISLSAYDPNERSRPADVGESISCAWRRILAAARRVLDWRRGRMLSHSAGVKAHLSTHSLQSRRQANRKRTQGSETDGPAN